MAIVPTRTVTTREDEGDTLDVAQLVRRAAAGDRSAWEGLVDQYSRLIWAITRDFKLVESDAADVTQATWLRLLEHIDRIQYPDRVGSWLAATARNECLRSLAARKKVVLADDSVTMEGVAAHEPEVDERLLAAERAQVVREALSCLPRKWQQMLELLMADPPASYAEISDQLGLPMGSIGPTRRRCLARLHDVLHPTLTDTQRREQGQLQPCSRLDVTGEGGTQPLRVHPAAAYGLDFGEGRPDLGHQVGEPGRGHHRDVRPRHPQIPFGR
jgi:RNA polymerase sigma factor (sigma-70 family)